MNTSAEIDLAIITLLNIPEAIIEAFEGENEEAAFFRVSGVKKGDVLTLQVRSKEDTGQGLLVEYLEKDRVLKGEASPTCEFTHLVEKDEESIGLDFWPMVKSLNDGGDVHRSVVLIFNLN